MTVNDWLWIGFYGMALGAAALLAYGWSYRTRDEENHAYLHLFVCLAAMASYLAMATGYGSVRLADGRDFYFARYVDWSVTTPLLLLGLSLTALHSPFRRWALLLGLLFTDVYMIVTGLFAGLSPTGSAAKWTWYLISSGAFLFIYYALFGPLRREAGLTGARAAALFKRNATVLAVLWFGYPVIFLLGDEGVRSVGPVGTAAAYTILDLLAKVAFGLFSLSGTKAKTTAELADGEVAEHDKRPAAMAYHEVHAPGRNERTAPEVVRPKARR